MSTHKIVREGQRLELRGETRNQLLDSSETDGALSLSRSRFGRGGGWPLHAHTREDEWFFVLSGEFEFVCGAQTQCVGVGHFVFGPRLVPHGYTCVSDEGGELLVGVAGGGFEEFFRLISVEGGQGTPIDFSAMRALCDQFGVRFDDFNALPAAEGIPKIGKASEVECLHAFGDSVQVLISSADTAGRFCLTASETPSLLGPPRHVHEREDEVFFLLAGDYEFQLGDARVQAVAGDVVLAPRGVPHTFRVVSGEAGRFLVFATPGGFDVFFRECAYLFHRGTVTPDGIGEIAARHALSFLPPED